MSPSVMTSVISLEEFINLKESLKEKLSQRLQDERDYQEFDAPPEEDLWDLPEVDSKTVVKLSPIVEEDTGMKINNKWIRQGGYNSVEEAIDDLIKNIEQAIQKN